MVSQILHTCASTFPTLPMLNFLNRMNSISVQKQKCGSQHAWQAPKPKLEHEKIKE
jgi:hypothetical protein